MTIVKLLMTVLKKYAIIVTIINFCFSKAAWKPDGKSENNFRNTGILWREKGREQNNEQKR